MEDIYQFFKELKPNNNREWFQNNKERFLYAKDVFEDFIQKIIIEISKFDPTISGVQVKESVFRIYRDVRFSHDKTPYKTHFGAFIVKGGKTNPRGGYYVHIEPGNSLLAGGIWNPSPALLKALRQDIYENAEEYLDIVENPELKRYYIYDDEKLAKVPTQFPSNLPISEWLKNKRFTLAAYFSDDLFKGEDAVEKIAELLKLLYPLNRFLNHTVDEGSQKFSL